MKKLLLILTLGAAFASCTKQEKFKQSSINAQVDSLVGVKMAEINQQAMVDLDHRISIEVKAKADSIVAARQKAMQPTK